MKNVRTNIQNIIILAIIERRDMPFISCRYQLGMGFFVFLLSDYATTNFPKLLLLPCYKWEQSYYDFIIKVNFVFEKAAIRFWFDSFRRGAELIKGLRTKHIELQAQREEEILQRIKEKMDRIKNNQQKLQPTMTIPTTHFEG